MARIKLTPEGFSEFSGPGISPARLLPQRDAYQDTLATLGMARQGVALAEEVGGLAGEGLDFLTKAGVFGGKKTREDIGKAAS